MTVTFSIEGNHENRSGNPIAKIRKTGRQSWTPQVQRYVGWKEYVRLAYFGGVAPKDQRTLSMGQIGRIAIMGGKPIVTKEPAHMSLDIFWADERHPDAEGVFGSIADALFHNDKEIVNGSFFCYHGIKQKGRVNVTISIPTL